MLSLLAESIIRGVFRSGIYIVLGLGISLILALTKVINVAHGSFLVLGAFLSYFIFNLLGLDPLLSIFVVFPVLFVAGFAFMKYVLGTSSTFQEAGESQSGYMMYALIVMFALTMVIDNLEIVAWTSDIRSIQTSYTTIGVNFGITYVPLIYIISFIIGVGISVGVYLFLNRARLGRAIRASIQDREAASMLGLNPAFLTQLVFGLGIGLAGISGVLTALAYNFSPTAGMGYLVKGFTVAILGGAGSSIGAVVGGLILAISEVLGATYLGSGFQDIMGIIIFLIVLSVRPKGLFGKYVI